MSISTQTKGNLFGLLTIILWSCSALFFSYAEPMPTFLLLSIISFLGGALFIVVWCIRSPKSLLQNLKPPLAPLTLSMIGTGAYSVLYCFSFKFAPIEEANIVNYLWPAFVVLFSSILLERKLSIHIMTGVLICFIGVCVFRIGLAFDFSAMTLQTGHLLALAGAFVWGSYSVLMRYLKYDNPNIPPIALLYTSVIFFLCHVLFEPSWQISMVPLVAATAWGFCLGMSYFSWNVAMSHGDVQMMGVVSYITPITSTLMLVTFGYPTMTTNLALATMIIVLGTLIASSDKIFALYRRYRNRSVQIS